MSLILLLNPKQYGGVIPTDVDTSDVLDRYRRKHSKEDVALEEELAARILQDRQTEITLPPAIDKKRLGNAIRSKLKNAEISAKKRQQIQIILLMIAADDYE